MKTHILIPIKDIKDRLMKLADNHNFASMGESVGIRWEEATLKDLLKTSKQLSLSKKITEQAASDYAGDRTQGAGHGWPSWDARLIEKGYNQAIKDILK